MFTPRRSVSCGGVFRYPELEIGGIRAIYVEDEIKNYHRVLLAFDEQRPATSIFRDFEAMLRPR